MSSMIGPVKIVDAQWNLLRLSRRLHHISLVFNSAADRIAADGWWRYGEERYKADRDPGLMPNPKCCIWSAVMEELAHRVHMSEYSLEERRAISNVVIVLFKYHFEVREIEEVFSLNDKQTNELGPAWAITNLREMARNPQLREV